MIGPSLHTPVNDADHDRALRNSLQKLAQLHVDLAGADKKWLDAETAARKVNALVALLNDFWRDLPQNREPVLQAAELASSRMTIIRAACAYDSSMNQSFAVRSLLRDTLDDFCIVVATYLERASSD